MAPTTKRPRTPTSKGAAEPPTKKKKTSKKKDKKKTQTKQPSSQQTATAAPSPSTNPVLTTTATQPPSDAADDDTLIMAQMIATFSHVEQSRFAAFTRASLDTTTVRDWVHTVLRHRNHQHNSSMDDDNTCLVVAMAAKSYAHRLLTTVVATHGPRITAPHVYAVAAEQQPTFYLQGNTTMVGGQAEVWEQRRVAALRAEEEYDALVMEEESAEDQTLL